MSRTSAEEGPGPEEAVVEATALPADVTLSGGGIDVEWRGVSVCVGASEKAVLQTVSGRAGRGQCVAIIGPSGSGKSMLLSVLSCRFRRKLRVISGEVLFDGRRWSKRLKMQVGFVEQDDSLFGALTVRQTLEFAAELRGVASPKARTEEILLALGLKSCSEQKIGGANAARGISGGQRRRVSVGMELILAPKLLLCDEPTSGLDSRAALRIFQTLSTMRDCTVVLTLHQPNDMMFNGMDYLQVLVAGRSAYFGTRAVEHFSNVGYTRIPSVPLADFVLDAACDHLHADADDAGLLFSTKKQDSVFTEKHLVPLDDDAPLKNYEEEEDDDEDSYRVSWIRQFGILLRRSAAAHHGELMDPLFIGNILAITALCALLWLGRASKRPRTENSVEDVSGLLFFQCVFWGFQFMIKALFAFGTDLAIVRKERAASLYKVSAFFLAHTMYDTLAAALVSPVAALLYYHLVGLRPSPSALLLHLVVQLLNSLASQSTGLAIGACVPQFGKATTIQSVYMLGTMLAGGFYVRSVPTWLSWIRWLSMTSYAYVAMAKVEFRGASYRCDDGGRCSIQDDLESFKNLRLDSSLAPDLIALLLFVLLFRLVGYLGLRAGT